MPRIAGPCGVVIFGVTGDLARKKLMPAIYDLANRGLLPPRSRWSGSPGGTGPTRTSARSCTTPSSSTPAPRSARRSGTGWPRESASCRAPSTTTRRSAGSPRRWTTRRRARHRRQSRVLPVDPAEGVPDGLRAAAEVRAGRRPQTGRWSRVVIEKPFGHDLRAPRSSTPSSTASSPRSRCSASTTTWARRPCRTCWRCGSPTSCSSRSGTPTTSTTCRSPWPRTSASAAGPATTTASARPAT